MQPKNLHVALQPMQEHLRGSEWTACLWQLVHCNAMVVGDFLPSHVLVQRFHGVQDEVLWPVARPAPEFAAAGSGARSFGVRLRSTSGVHIDLAELDKDNVNDSSEEENKSDEDKSDGMEDAEMLRESLGDLAFAEEWAPWAVSDDDDEQVEAGLLQKRGLGNSNCFLDSLGFKILPFAQQPQELSQWLFPLIMIVCPLR